MKALGSSLIVATVLSVCVLYLTGPGQGADVSPRGTQVHVLGSKVGPLHIGLSLTYRYTLMVTGGPGPVAAAITLSPGWGPLTFRSLKRDCGADLPDPTIVWQHGATIAFAPGDCGYTTGIDLTPTTGGKHWFVIRTYESPSQRWHPTYEFKSDTLAWSGSVTK